MPRKLRELKKLLKDHATLTHGSRHYCFVFPGNRLYTVKAHSLNDDVADVYVRQLAAYAGLDKRALLRGEVVPAKDKDPENNQS